MTPAPSRTAATISKSSQRSPDTARAFRPDHLPKRRAASHELSSISKTSDDLSTFLLLQLNRGPPVSDSPVSTYRFVSHLRGDLTSLAMTTIVSAEENCNPAKPVVQLGNVPCRPKELRGSLAFLTVCGDSFDTQLCERVGTKQDSTVRRPSVVLQTSRLRKKLELTEKGGTGTPACADFVAPYSRPTAKSGCATGLFPQPADVFASSIRGLLQRISGVPGSTLKICFETDGPERPWKQSIDPSVRIGELGLSEVEQQGKRPSEARHVVRRDDKRMHVSRA
jgi:hypothetical protein